MHAGRGAVLALLVAGALWSPLGPPSPAGAAEAPPALLVPADASPASRAAGGRPVEVVTDLLQPGVARTVTVDVPGPDLTVDLAPTEASAPGWATWTGAVEGAEHSSVDLVRRGDVVSGALVTEDGGYRIQAVAGGGHVVRPVRTGFVEGDDTLEPPAGWAPDPVPAPSGPPAPGADVRADAAPVVDVLVAYTPAALAEAGSVGAMEAEIALGISATNAALTTSAVTGRVRLAGVMKTSANVLADSAGLWSATMQNGVLDEVPTRRTALGADLVSVFTGETETGCGIGWILSSLTQGGALGYSLVDWQCAVDNNSMAHEIGHNMGLEHDRYVSPNNVLFDHGHGYVNVAGGWRTIMAYNDACAAASTFCTRLRRFSNPAQTYLGDPVGIAPPHPQSADEQRVLDVTFPIVAGWRATPAPFTSWAAFVRQQGRDFDGVVPSSSVVTTQANRLANGDVSPTTYIASKAHGTTFGGAYAPVARLYFAYFLRTPDKSGLDFWVGRYRGGQSLTSISNGFAASQEFRARYGTLTNQAFVQKVYLNVLGRPADSAGLAFWTGQLDQGKRTRGAVMVGFSEASEYKRVRAEEIDTVLLYRAMLQRTPTPTEFQTEVARLEDDTSLAQVITDLLALTEYRNRITR